MPYFDNETSLLKYSSTSGGKVISRDFKDKTILYKSEIITLVDEDFYRDGDNSSMEYKFDVDMIIITNMDNEYLIHSYQSDVIEVSNYNPKPKYETFTDEDIKYTTPSKIRKLSDIENEFKDKVITNDVFWHWYNIVKFSNIKEMIFRMKKMAKVIWAKQKPVYFKR